MNTQILDQYATKKLQLIAIEEELEALKPQVVAAIQEQEADQIDHAAGLFSLQARRSWTYPLEIQLQEENLKAEKKQAEQLGTATYSEKPVLVFKAKA